MKRQTKNCMPILKPALDTTIESNNGILKPNNSISTPCKSRMTQRKLDDEKKVRNNLPNDPTSQRGRKIQNNINSDNDFFSPCKNSSDTYDTTHIGEFEVVNMLHDLDEILDFDDVTFQSDSMVHYITPDVIINILDSEVEQQIDPLLITNEINTNKNTRRNQSPFKNSKPQKLNKTNEQPITRRSSRLKFKSNNKTISGNSENLNYSSTDEITYDTELILEEVHDVELQEVLSPLTVKKLKHLEIRLRHKVPPQHKIENNAGSRAPTQEQKNLFEEYETIIRGKFTEEEDNIIRKNWKSFCRIHKWDSKNVQPFLYMRHQGKFYIPSIKERQKFVQFLANGLPCRTLYSVYHRFRNLFAKKFHKTKGRFTEEEDKKIMLYMQCATSSNKQFAELAKILGRTRHSVWHRYQSLKKLSSPKSEVKEKKVLPEVIWTVPLLEEFVQQLMNLSLNENVQQLKNAVIPKVVWEEMEAKMHISQDVLKQLWFRQLHMQLFSPITIYLNDVKIKLIEYLYETGVSHPKDINWSKVCSLFDGMTTDFIVRVFYDLVRFVRRKIYSKKFIDIVEYLHNVVIPYIKGLPSDKYLPRIIFENERLVFIKEEVEEMPNRVSEHLSHLRKRKAMLEDNSDVTWTLPMRKNFVETLLHVTLCNDIYELKNAIIPRVVWQEMGEKMKMDEEVLINLWYKELHMQLFSPNPIFMNDIKVKLIELIYHEQITDLNQIVWPNVCKYFDGMTPIYVSEVFYELVLSASNVLSSKNFCEVIDYLYKRKIPELKDQPDDNYLPRIFFKGKTMEFIVEEYAEGMEIEQERTRTCSASSEETNYNLEVIWTLSMREKFIKKLLVVTLSSDIIELKDAIIPTVVWEEMAKRMKIDRGNLRNIWYFEIHMQLFCPHPILLNAVEIKLIEYIYNEQLIDLNRIVWTNVCQYFPGFTSVFLSKVFHQLFELASEKINSDDFSDIMTYLYTKQIPILKHMNRDQTLPRLSYDKGSVKIVDDEISHNF